MKFFQFLKGKPKRNKWKISEEEALELAHAYCLEKNWPWYGKIDIRSEGSKWSIMTNSENLGGNVNIRISKRTGEILSAGFASR